MISDFLFEHIGKILFLIICITVAGSVFLFFENAKATRQFEIKNPLAADCKHSCEPNGFIWQDNKCGCITKKSLHFVPVTIPVVIH